MVLLMYPIVHNSVWMVFRFYFALQMLGFGFRSKHHLMVCLILVWACHVMESEVCTELKNAFPEPFSICSF